MQCSADFFLSDTCCFRGQTSGPPVPSAAGTLHLFVLRRKNLHVVAHLLGLKDAVGVVETQHVCTERGTKLTTAAEHFPAEVRMRGLMLLSGLNVKYGYS